MEKERKITAPEGSETEKVELVDGVSVITFREKERKLPKSWEEFRGGLMFVIQLQKPLKMAFVEAYEHSSNQTKEDEEC